MNCANRQGLFRLIMSVPSPKAEPFRLWLAQVGEERLLEIDNPELAIERGNGLGLFLVATLLQGEQLKVVFDAPEIGGTIAKVLG